MQGAVAPEVDRLEDPQVLSRKSVHGSPTRNWALFLCVLPTLLLGATYFLLVEFALREPRVAGGGVLTILRFGGMALGLLFVLAALGCGLVLADRFLRPLKALLRVAEGSEGPDGSQGSTAYLSTSDPELRGIFVRVRILVQQNRTGGEALRELESLHGEVAELCNALRRVGGRILQVQPTQVRPDGPAAMILQEIEQGAAGLKEGLQTIERGLVDLNRILAQEEKASATCRHEVEAALQEIERWGTVWSLEIERARRDLPGLPGTLGSCFREFGVAMERLRGAARVQGDPVGTLRQARTEIAKHIEAVRGLSLEAVQAEGGDEAVSARPTEGGT